MKAPWYWRAAAVAIGLSAAAIAAEGVLRVIPRPWDRSGVVLKDGEDPWRFDAGPGWAITLADDQFWRTFPAGATLEMRNPSYHAFAHIDRWGGRVTSASSPPPEVAFLGDSMLFGIGVEDDQTFTSLLDARFGRPIVNLGVPGSSLPFQLRQLADRYEAIARPRVAVFWFFPGNDLSDIMDAAGQTESARPVRSALEHELNATNRFVGRTSLLRRSKLVGLLRAAARGWLVRIPWGGVDDIFQVTAPSEDDYRRRAAAELERQLDAMVAECDRLGVAPIVAVVPDQYQVYPSLLASEAAMYRLAPASIDITYPDRILAAGLARRHVPLVETLDCMKTKGDGLFFPERHLTVKGNQALAACAADALGAAIDRVEPKGT